MPTNLIALSAAELHVRYKSPVLTRDLNEKLAVITPRGVYRGFRLTTSGTVLSVTVAADSDNSDHVADVQTTDGYSLTVRRTGGDFVVDLSSYAAKTVIIALFVEYLAGSATDGYVRAYELSPSDEFTGATERGELVVLGQVVVPASGLIGESSITVDYRDTAWKSEAPGNVRWNQLLKDPSFEWGEDGISLQEGYSRVWDMLPVPSANGEWSFSTGANKFGGKGLSYYFQNVAAHSGYVYQDLDAPIVPGQQVYYRFWVRNLAVPSAGTVSLQIYTADTDLGSAALTILHTLDLSSTDASHRLVEGDFVLPAASTARFIRQVRINHNALNYASAGTKYYLDALEVFLEEKGESAISLGRTLRSPVTTTRLMVEDTGGLFTSEAAHISMDEATPRLIIGRRGQSIGLETALGQIALGEGDLGTDVRAAIPRVTVPGRSGTYTTLLESTQGSVPGLRMLRSSLGALVVTFNARWDGADWNADSTGDDAWKYLFDESGLRGFRRASAPASWLDSAWDSPELINLEGQLEIGAGMVGSSTAAAIARLVMSTINGPGFTLLMESGAGSGDPRNRLYCGQPSGNDFVVTYNARWDGADWNPDDTTVDSRKVFLKEDGLHAQYKAQPHASAWLDTAWDDSTLGVPGALLDDIGADFIGSASDAELPRLEVPTRAGTFTQVLQTGIVANDTIMRLYVDLNGSLVITHNAWWDSGSGWNADDTSGNDARKWEFGTDGLRGYVQTSLGSAWNDNAWVYPATLTVPSLIEAGGDLDNSAQVEEARFRAVTLAANYSLLMDTSTGSGTAQLRLYKGNNETFVVTYNARWDSATQWNSDTTSVGAHKYVFGEKGLDTYYAFIGKSSPWLDSAWDGEGLNWGGQLALDIKGVIDVGEGLSDTATNADIARIEVPTSATGYLTLVFKAGNIRIYCESSGGMTFFLTINAEYDNPTSNWSSDDNGRRSVAFRMIDLRQWEFWYNDATAGTWTTWTSQADNKLTIDADGPRWELDDGYIELVSSASGSGTNDELVSGGRPNQLRARNIVKAYGRVQTDGVGGVTLDSTSAFNVASVSMVGTGGTDSQVRFTWNVDFAIVNYCLFATCDTSSVGFFDYGIHDQAVGSADVELYNGAGTLIAMDGNQTEFYILAIGAQN